jgi:hypothetical protein
MSYFNELPNLQYGSRFIDQSNNIDTVLVKNIFRRAKLRDDIANAVTAFQYYQITDNERPDQIAENIYSDPTLDWVILVTNNIIDINNEWPLDNESFYNYLLDKYGSDEEIQKVHHIETVETRDSYNRLVVPNGFYVDNNTFTPDNIITQNDRVEYELSNYPVIGNTKVKVNLNQYIDVYHRDLNVLQYPITDIQIETSNLKITSRQQSLIDITITNSLDDWPLSWGGSFTIDGRNEDTLIDVGDYVGDVDIELPNTLYKIQNNNGTPSFILGK